MCVCVCGRVLFLLCGQDKQQTQIHTLLRRASEGVQRLGLFVGSCDTLLLHKEELYVCGRRRSITEYVTRVPRTHPKLPVSVLVHQQPHKGEHFIGIQAALPNINFPDKSALSA